jgi:4-diphosphocytidyl-2-C-methyl-D-erythritol kinase
MFAPAKVNLYLAVTGRRADGYHLLDSLAVFPAIGDVIHATLDDDLSLAITGPFAGDLTSGDDNLVLRAARALATNAGIGTGARIILDKRLPLASGIGGGSADAAATLRLLSDLWGIETDLAALAVGLGADVPVCLASRPARMRGIGDRLSPAPKLPPCGILLANPNLAVATAAVFSARSGDFSPAPVLPAGWDRVADLAADLARTSNDLQAPAIALCPPIADVLAAIAATPGNRFARMSGSGATCFGLYDTPSAAEAAARTLKRTGWWSWGGALRAAGKEGPLELEP